jgi:hypothetical protein
MKTNISPLLLSAKDFLVEALENYDMRQLNFSIVHAVTAAELVLKERLARIHPCLVFKNIDSVDIKKEQTVLLRHIPQRLNNLGVSILTEEAKLIRTFADWRNQIVHHMPSFDETAAGLQLPQLLDFISMFLRRDLDLPLEDFLPKRLYRTAKGILKEWERVISDAREKAKHDDNTISIPCPHCGVPDVLTLIDGRKVSCYLCNSKDYYYDYCVQCGRKTLGTFSAVDEGIYCDGCIKAAGDQYIQTIIDIEREK